MAAGAFQTTFGGGYNDIFVTKLNSTGTALIYSTYLGGSNSDLASSIDVDTAGNAYIIGHTSSTDFDNGDKENIETNSDYSDVPDGEFQVKLGKFFNENLTTAGPKSPAKVKTKNVTTIGRSKNKSQL